MPGEQKDFAVIPDHSRDYTFSTFGRSDTVMVLFEDIDGDPVYMKGDDDSGFNRNARFTVRLIKGRKYILRIPALLQLGRRRYSRDDVVSVGQCEVRPFSDRPSG